MPTNAQVSSNEHSRDHEDPVDLTSEDSFPASDAPAWAIGQLLDGQEGHHPLEDEAKTARERASERDREREESA